MNREIKFRAWLKTDWKYNETTNEMDDIYKMFHSCYNGNGDLALWHEDIDDYYSLENNLDTLMQYIGRECDITNKPIYEGDIVEITIEGEPFNKWVGVVKFDSCSFYIDTNYSTHYRWMDYGVKLLGNMFENPDLYNKIINED